MPAEHKVKENISFYAKLRERKENEVTQKIMGPEVILNL